MAGPKEIQREELVEKFLELFRRADLSEHEYALCTAALIDKVRAIPTRDIFVLDEQGGLTGIRGKKLEVTEAAALRESARSALGNQALKLIRQHVDYAAVDMGVHKAVSVYQLSFSKAAIWYGQEELRMLHLLAQLDFDPDTQVSVTGA